MFSLNRQKFDAKQQQQPVVVQNPATVKPTGIPTLVLNMIVKNETRVIERMLKSVAPLIDHYVICDTGSTDGTPDIIRRFFKTEFPHIQGVVTDHPFRDFGYNRSYALRQCQEYFPKADYVLLMDADMVLWVPPDFKPAEFKRGLHTSDADVFLLFQGGINFYTKNARICRNCPGYSYLGVTHEYLDTPSKARYLTVERSDIHILDVGDGGAKSDKYERDIRLLQDGLAADPTNGRYMFYLGNSFKDSGKFDKAIDVYQRRIQQGGWFEETWMSYYCMGCCYRALGKKTEAFQAWIDAYEVCPDRIENLYELVHEYRVAGKNHTAYQYYEMAQRTLQKKGSKPLDFLFTQADVYQWKLDFEFTIVGYYALSMSDPVHQRTLIQSCMRLLAFPYLPYEAYHNILCNYKHCLLPLPTCGQHTLSLPTLQGNNREEFVQSTPSIVRHTTSTTDERYWVNVRYVNYRINDEGGYENQEHIHTRNILFPLYPTADEIPHEWQYDTKWDNVYVGLEDCRLFSHMGKLHYSANRGTAPGKMQVEIGCVCPQTGKTYNSRLLKSPENRDIEKNWVLFSKGDELWMVYDWSKLQMGRVPGDNSDRFEIQVSHAPQDIPAFFRDVRGSTNGVSLADQREIWFLCHFVSYEERRYYYHLFVVLDADTLQLKKWTPLFVFEKYNPVEYSLGFVIDDGGKNWIVSKSSMDRTAELVIVPIQDIPFVEPV